MLTPGRTTRAAGLTAARDNHRYLAKDGTPVARLLPMLGGALNLATFNDVITLRRLPDCAQYLRRQAGRG